MRHLACNVQSVIIPFHLRYLSHKLDDLARRINIRISDSLEFDLNGLPIPAENYQLMNYGIGEELLELKTF